MDRAQPGVARANAIVTGDLQMLQEAGDGWRIQVLEVQPARGLAGRHSQVAQQQAESVTVSGHCVRAGVTLTHQPVGKEPFERWGEGAHGWLPQAHSSRSAASASNSGAAWKYQYVDVGSTWPKYVESSGSCACTSMPAWYQLRSVRSTNVCRRSCSRGGRDRCVVPSPGWSRRWAKAACTLLRESLPPRDETKKLAHFCRGHSRFRWWLYAWSASTVLRWRGTCLGLLNLPQRTTMSGPVRSTSC